MERSLKIPVICNPGRSANAGTGVIHGLIQGSRLLQQWLSPVCFVKPYRVISMVAVLAMLVPGVGRAGQSPPPGQNPVIPELAQAIDNGDYPGLQGMMISLHGEIIMEAYAPRSKAGDQHDIRSATKSITALLLGILIDDGAIKSVKQPIAKLVPDSFAHLPEGDVRREITLEDALTMRTGLACNDWAPSSVGNEDKMYKTDDWVAFLLAQPIAYDIGEYFSYCTGGVVLLGRVIEKLSGQTVPAFAQQRLFGPLGINDAKWAMTPTGHTDTGGHLELTLGDMHRIGLLVARNGRWEGRQLVSERWIRTITSEQTSIPERRERFGYLWWLNSGEVSGQPLSLIYAHGNGGNFIFFVPELNLVAASNANNYGKREQFIPMQILSEQLIPALIASSHDQSSE